MYGFQKCSRPAARIDRAIDPGVAMAASHDPIVRQLSSAHSADDIPDGPVLVILLEVNLDANRSWTEGARMSTDQTERSLISSMSWLVKPSFQVWTPPEVE